MKTRSLILAALAPLVAASGANAAMDEAEAPEMRVWSAVLSESSEDAGVAENRAPHAHLRRLCFVHCGIRSADRDQRGECGKDQASSLHPATSSSVRWGASERPRFLSFPPGNPAGEERPSSGMEEGRKSSGVGVSGQNVTRVPSWNTVSFWLAPPGKSTW